MSDDFFWCYPTHVEINQDGKTIYDLLDEYKCFLETYHSERCKSFHELCCAESEAARAEAVTFSFFKWNGYDVQVEESSSEGGVDFRVQKGNIEFLVEVTSILRETFTEHSGVPERYISGVVDKNHLFYETDLYKVVHLIRSEASSKADQMSDYPCPRILVIACEHHEYANLLQYQDLFGANMLLTSTPKQEIETKEDGTALDDSLFFRFQNGRMVFCRKSISAVLLFYISKYHTATIGLLHPTPAYKFLIEFLPSVPFGKILVPEMEDYSVGNPDRIRTRWRPGDSPNGLFIYNQWC